MSQQINLFNPIFLKQKKYFSATTIVQSLVIIAVGMVGFWGLLVFQGYALDAQRAETAAQLQQIQAELLKVATETGRKTKSSLLEDEIVLADNRIKNQQEVMKALQGTSIGNPEGFSRYLVALARQTVSGLWLTGFSINADGNALVIRGRVLRPELVPIYIHMLNREEVLRGRRFSELKMTAKDEAPPQAVPASGDSASKLTLPQHYVEFSLVAEKMDDPSSPAATIGKTTGSLQ